MYKKQSILCLLIPLLFSCTNGIQESPVPEPRVRAALKSTGTGSVKASVVVEGPDGNALSGALITVRDQRNILTPLNFETAAYTYTGTMEEYEGISEFVIEVSSVTLRQPLKMVIPYASISELPKVTVFQDAAGNSVLNGQTLASDQPVQIGWKGCGDNAVYQITIKTAFKKIYAAATNAETITVPANVIPAGSYLLEITAQHIYGDMYFNTAPYYSVSAGTAPLVSCNVN